MLNVFRIEHRETKVGPFQTPGEFTQQLATVASTKRKLKAPCNDGLTLGLIPFFFVFGCPDLQTLREWFLLGKSEEENETIVRSLEELGFVLAEYLVETEDCRIGKSRKQLVFDADSARRDGLVQFHDLDALLADGAEACAVH